MKPLLVMGLNSGTSMDGVDAALFRIGPQGVMAGELGSLHMVEEDRNAPRLAAEMLASVVYEFDPSLRRKMKGIVSSGSASLEDLCRLNAALGEEFASAAQNLLSISGRSRNEVDLIGSHGQTIWHAPSRRLFGQVECASTMQLGEPAIIAMRTGIPVVADFRVADMAAGGQGAPLVAFADEVLFGSCGDGVGVLNIGGIANITAIGSEGRALLAFDTGPGNMLIDRAMESFFSADFDRNGATAAKGQVSETWIAELLRHPYYAAEPPKTTGREMFGTNYADELLIAGQQQGLSHQDIVATLTSLTAASIADQYSRYIEKSQALTSLVLGGGGAENAVLVEQLRRRWPHEVEIRKHEDFGISTKFKEALLFALLAYSHYFRLPNNVPICTGARRRVSMGKMCLP